MQQNQMIAENSDIIALTAQADIDRIYVKVIRPALAEFAPGDVKIIGDARNINEFLESIRINTHNSLCYELRRTLVLVIGALFERQLRFWLSERVPSKKKNVENARWPQLKKLINQVDHSITTNALMDDLEDLWLLTTLFGTEVAPVPKACCKGIPLCGITKPPGFTQNVIRLAICRLLMPRFNGMSEPS